jgi:hypothetical protein
VSWGHEYHSSLSITLSLLSLDRDDTNEEDYERYCVTCFAAELEEELDSQDKEERKIAKVHKRTGTFHDLSGFQVFGKHHEILCGNYMGSNSRHMDGFTIYSTRYRLRMSSDPSRLI